MSKLTTAMLCACAITIATPVQAHKPDPSTLATDCTAQPCIYDSHGTIVGLAQGQNNQFSVLLRPMNGTWYQVLFYQSGFKEDARLLNASANCTGQTYVIPSFEGPDPVVLLPPFAYWDGSALWGAVGTMVANISINSQFESGSCSSFAWTAPYAFTATKVDTTIFYPPFTIK